MKVKSEREVAQSCPILRDSMDHSLPGYSVHGIFQARVLEWGAIAMVIYINIFIHHGILSSVQVSSVAQSSPTLCDPVNHSTPGLSVHHHLLEFTQTDVH